MVSPRITLFHLRCPLTDRFRLEPFAPAIKTRYSAYKQARDNIEKWEGSLAKFSEGYKTMGFQVDDNGGVRYREWAPNAVEARLIGDFSKSSAVCDGVFPAHLPQTNGRTRPTR
jgi:1,4-alpha-glucan branching enzyme